MRRAAVATLALLALAGCSAPVPAPAPTATVTQPGPTVTATATVTASPPLPDPPASLRVGKWAQLEAVRVRARKISDRGSGSSDDGPTMSVLVQACNSGDDNMTLSWSPWSVTGSDGGRFPALTSTNDDDPKPRYPFFGDETYRPGECALGWIVFGVNKSTKVAGVRYANEDGQVATWKV